MIRFGRSRQDRLAELNALHERISVLTAEIEEMQRVADARAEAPDAKETSFNQSRSLRHALLSQELFEKGSELAALIAQASALEGTSRSRADSRRSPISGPEAPSAVKRPGPPPSPVVRNDVSSAVDVVSEAAAPEPTGDVGAAEVALAVDPKLAAVETDAVGDLVSEGAPPESTGDVGAAGVALVDDDPLLAAESDVVVDVVSEAAAPEPTSDVGAAEVALVEDDPSAAVELAMSVDGAASESAAPPTVEVREPAPFPAATLQPTTVEEAPVQAEGSAALPRALSVVSRAAEPVPSFNHWLLKGLPPEHVAALQKVVKERHFRPGELIFREGETVDGLYLVTGGSIRVAARDERDHWRIVVAQRDAVIGEMGVLDGQTRDSTATAVGTASAYFIAAAHVQELLEVSPVTCMRLMVVLTRKLRNTNAARVEWAAARREAKAAGSATLSTNPKLRAQAETRKYLAEALPLVKSLDREFRRWIASVTEGPLTLWFERDPQGRLTNLYLWRVAQNTKSLTVMRPSKATEKYHRALVLCTAAREAAAHLFGEAASSVPIKDPQRGISAAKRQLLEAERQWGLAEAARRVLEADPSLSSIWSLWHQAPPVPSSTEKAVTVAPPLRGALPQVGEQADILRALGRFLEEQGAKRGIEIKGHEGFLSVFWSSDGPAGAQRAYQLHALDRLRARAHAMRKGTDRGTSDGTISELLRTIGQQLDEEEIEVTGISQEAGGFRVSGLRDSVYYTRLWVSSEIDERSTERRGIRKTKSR